MVLRYLQRLGKSLMLPIAVLPVCAILMGLGYAFDQGVMSGTSTVLTQWNQYIAFFLVKAGSALIDNMGILFAIGVAIGMSDDQNGAAALAGLVSWLVVTTLCSAPVASMLGVFNVTNADGTVVANPAFTKITSQFIGIATGILGGHTYNMFKNTQLPAALSFFSGKRSVAIVTAGFSVILSLVLYLVWPFLYTNVLVAFGKLMSDWGYWGAGLYAFFNRLLIPFGLHHALNSCFWFDVAGISDIATFWGGKWDAALGAYVNGDGVIMSVLKDGQAGMFQAGFFPIMMFGLPGAALAMYHTAKPEKKKQAFGILGAAAVASFVSGVTEPLEFAFMFLAPVLYVVHAFLTAICVLIVAALPIRAGFWFSAGLIDYIFSCLVPNAKNIWALPLIGLGFGVIYYFVFRIMIVKLDLKTPGREDDEDEAQVTLANNDYTEVAKVILEGLGGKENIKTVDNCITRLRLEIVDYTKVNEKMIKSAGVSGVIRPSKTSVQVIVGTKVQFVADEMKKML